MTFDPYYCTEGGNFFVGGSSGDVTHADEGSVIKNHQLPSGATMTYSTDIVEEDLHYIYTLLNGELTRSPNNDKEIHRVKDEMISLHRNNPTEVLTLQRCYGSIRADRKLIEVLFGLLGGGSVWTNTKWESPFSHGAALNYLNYETVNNIINSIEWNHSGEGRSKGGSKGGNHHQSLSNIYKCVSCKKVCTHVYYILKPNNVKKISYGVLDKCVWCNACFNSSKYPSILNRSNFVKVNIPYSFLGNDWSVTEIEKLIDGISKYKNNWEKISESVGTKSAYECIYKFTSMPLSNPYFDVDNLFNINNVSFKSFKQNNTL
ncbi:hypothetical protein PCYB_145090, partial [Plasmodium cynomolgi strain B]